MEKIYSGSEEKLMKEYVLYANDTNKLYTDSSKTVKVTNPEIINAFKKGLIVDKAGVLYRPTTLSVASEVATVSLVIISSGSASALEFVAPTA